MASGFYYKNRYTTYEECLNPCKIMTITIIPKFKFVKEGIFDVELYIARQVKITKEVFVKSLLSAGTYILRLSRQGQSVI